MDISERCKSIVLPWHDLFGQMNNSQFDSRTVTDTMSPYGDNKQYISDNSVELILMSPFGDMAPDMMCGNLGSDPTKPIMTRR